SKILCLKLLPKSMNGELFKEFIKETLIPQLWQGAVVVMDNLNAHKVEGVKEMLEAAGAKVIYLPRYSPDFNPIEHLWWELKAFIRRFRPKDKKSVEKLAEIGVMLNSATTRQNYFTHCCYCAS
ncbi:transposase, partial [Synechocystis salina]